jgi:hypothetical protein
MSPSFDDDPDLRPLFVVSCACPGNLITMAAASFVEGHNPIFA